MRKNTKLVDTIIVIVLIVLTACILLALVKPGSSDKAGNAQQEEYTSAEQLSEKKVGVMMGSVYEKMLEKSMPNAEVSFFDKASDMALAVLSDKIEGFVCSEAQAKKLIAENPGLKMLDTGEVNEIAFAFQKNDEGSALCQEFSDYLAKIKADGLLDRFKSKWLKGEGDQKLEDVTLTGTKGKLRMATTGTTEPFSFMVNSELCGLDIELARGFCAEYGYDLEIDVMDFGAMIPALSSGSYDFAGANITITDERAESVYFSDSYTQNRIMMVVEGTQTEELTYEAYNGKKIGILTGTNMEAESFKYFPDSEYLYYDGYPNLNAALTSGKIDAYLGDEPALKSIHAEQPQIDYLKERLTNNQYSFAFRKDEPSEKQLCDQFNEFLRKSNADGTIAEIDAIWFGVDESKKIVDMSDLTGENGTIHVVTTSTDEPFSYIKDGKNVGYDIDVVVRFCRENGYALELGDVDFQARIPALASGKYEFTTSMNVTPEREEEVMFSDPVSSGGIVVAVRAEDLQGAESTAVQSSGGWLDSIKSSFVKNFIREDRWKLIVQGIGVTCLITALAALFGSLLGFLVCMFRRTGSKLANTISDLYVKLLQGTPIVVLLMILYYVIFGKSGIDAIWVAVIGFSLNCGAYASEIMRSGIESIDGGQREAALALGYTENQSFFRFIFPQAAVRFLPVYNGEIVSLLKSTSVVGYIAIQDLTKMSDIIRSRTYEAFFPLIATAVIYFLLAWIISLLMKLILHAIDARSRKRRAAK